MNDLRVIWSLAARELVRFFRQRNRVIGALGQPLIFWLLFSAGLGPSFRLPGSGTGEGGESYAEYFFPGTVALILLFTAIFATISIIEDRREGFLQSVLVAPIPRWSMVLGKLLGGTLVAVAQGLLFLLLGLTLGLHYSVVSLVAITAFMFTLALALTGLGFVIAWRMDSTQGFHAVMSVFLFPMWLLSGAFFPAEHGWLAWVLAANPMTYGVAGLRQLLYLHPGAEAGAATLALPSLATCWIVTLLFAAITFAASCKMAGTRTTGDLL
ncbi:MAG TPA: ABC transporter permease [Pirellulales bacterium]|jgi:ABC-2 type transport system permease protein|nr:ABC transporter permease [Pirellulales bacterium]